MGGSAHERRKRLIPARSSSDEERRSAQPRRRQRRQLYVAVGDPGVIDVIDTRTMKRLASVATEKGAHTTALAPAGDRVYAFLPATHRAAVYQVN
jgi:hypothetical protein